MSGIRSGNIQMDFEYLSPKPKGCIRSPLALVIPDLNKSGSELVILKHQIDD